MSAKLKLVSHLLREMLNSLPPLNVGITIPFMASVFVARDLSNRNHPLCNKERQWVHFLTDFFEVFLKLLSLLETAVKSGGPSVKLSWVIKNDSGLTHRYPLALKVLCSPFKRL